MPLGPLCDMLAYALPLPLELKQQLLDEPHVDRRAEILAHALRASSRPGTGSSRRTSARTDRRDPYPHTTHEEPPMEKRTNAVTFKGNPVTLVGPQLKAGDKAPDFKCARTGLDPVTLADTPAKARLFSVVPSLDTPVCSTQTKKFEEAIAALGDKVACYTVSLDLPFAQKRFCTAENVTT